MRNDKRRVLSSCITFKYVIVCKHRAGVDEDDGNAYVAVLVFAVHQVPAVYADLCYRNDDSLTRSDLDQRSSDFKNLAHHHIRLPPALHSNDHHLLLHAFYSHKQR